MSPPGRARKELSLRNSRQSREGSRQRLLLSLCDLNIVPDKDVLVVTLPWTFRR